MGQAVVEAVNAAPDCELVAAIDMGVPPTALMQAGAEVIVDFTTPDAVMRTLKSCIANGIHCVIGTTGFDDSKLAKVSEWCAAQPKVGVLIAPNFGIGAVLMMRMAELASPYFESAEIIEMHHPDKVDAPSGTATRTAEMIAAARSDAGSAPQPDATSSDPDGARGAKVDGVPVHSVRARGFVASQEVVLGGVGETLSIRHDSSNRDSFMPGVVAAVQAVGAKPGVTVGLESVLGL